MSPDAPPFDEPWQAQAFAIVVALNERGLFSWGEWAEALGAELSGGPQESGNSAYFQAWLNTLENLLVAKGVAGARSSAISPKPGSPPPRRRRTASRSCSEPAPPVDGLAEPVREETPSRESLTGRARRARLQARGQPIVLGAERPL